MRRTNQTPEEIAEEMAKGRLNPFDAFGKHWQGDIFYSDIHYRTKKMPASAFQKVCDLLRGMGYYVHGDGQAINDYSGRDLIDGSSMRAGSGRTMIPTPGLSKW